MFRTVTGGEWTRTARCDGTPRVAPTWHPYAALTCWRLFAYLLLTTALANLSLPPSSPQLSLYMPEPDVSFVT